MKYFGKIGTMHFARRPRFLACAWVAVAGLVSLTTSNAFATDFPVGTVSVNFIFTSACTNISGTGAVSGASATRVGSDFKISIPAGGPLLAPLTVTVVNIPTTTLSNQTALPATVNLTGAETISGPGFGLLQLEDGVPVASGTSLSTFGPGCQVVFTIFGNNPKSTSANGANSANSASSVTLQSSRAMSRSTAGVFVDTVNAAGSALRYLQKTDPLSTAQLSEGNGDFQMRGLSAGDSAIPIGLWGNFAYFSSENDATGEQSDSSGLYGTIGADVAITESGVLGLSVGYERDDTDTLFNAGNSKTTGLTVATYLGVLINENLSADVAFGRSFLDTDQYRTSGATRVTSDMDGNRTFVAGNLNYYRQWGQWSATGRGGFLWLRDTQDAFTENNGAAVAESRFNLGRGRLSAELGRTIGNFEPYINATFSHTLSQTETPTFLPSRDRSDVLLGIGVRYFAAETMSGFFEFTTLLGRRQVEEHSASFLIRAEF